MNFQIRLKKERYMLNLTQDQRLDAWRVTLNPHQERIQIP